MESVLLRVDYSAYIVQYELKGGWYYGSIYPVDEWTKQTGESGVSFLSKHNSSDTFEEINDDCRCLFSFNFCWRGVWDGRLYFKDDEYWSHELDEMKSLWEMIELMLKEKLIKIENINE